MQHVGNAVVSFGDSFDALPALAAVGNKVVIRVHHQKSRDELVICQSSQASSLRLLSALLSVPVNQRLGAVAGRLDLSPPSDLPHRHGSGATGHQKKVR